MSRPRWACLARRRISGGGAGSPKVRTGSRIGRVDRVRCPHQTAARLERRIVRLRQRRKLGPARIASIVRMPASTVHRVLCRHGLNRLAWMDRPTGQVIRRIHTDRPGELVHVDVKKLGPDPTRRWLASTWSRQRRAPVERPSRLRLHPLRDRRAQPPRVQRDPRQRARPDLRRVLGTCPTVLRRPCDHGRSGPDRQREELHRQTLHMPRSAGSSIAGSGPADPKPTAKSNGSTAPSPTNGPTPASTRQTANGPEPLTASSTPTTITAATPPSEANHPSPAPTSRDNTSSRPATNRASQVDRPTRPRTRIPEARASRIPDRRALRRSRPDRTELSSRERQLSCRVWPSRRAIHEYGEHATRTSTARRLRCSNT